MPDASGAPIADYLPDSPAIIQAVAA